MRALIWINLDNKMADCGRLWSDEEVQCLLALWSDQAIQRELSGMYRKAPVWQKLADKLKKRNFKHTPTQVDTEIKQLRKSYKEEVDKLQRSGVLGKKAAMKIIFT